MPVVSLVRRLVAMPAAALTIGERLLDDLGRLHQQMERASGEGRSPAPPSSMPRLVSTS